MSRGGRVDWIVMSFLAPLFLAGALAVGLPVVFHLIRRTSREQIPFSSLMFLQPTPPRMTKRSRLEHILLLLLRCLVICLLALGFSRPFFQKPMMAGAPPENSRKIMLLVDVSASMRRNGVWQAAVSKVADVLKQIKPGDQVALATFDTQTHPVVTFEQWAAMNASDRASITSGRFGELKPGWKATRLGDALIAASETLNETGKKDLIAGIKRIVLISDMQEGSRLEGLQGHDWPRGIEVQVEPVKVSKPTNAGLQWIIDTQDTSATEAQVQTRVRVSNSTDAKHEQFALHWSGVPGAKALDVYVPPGQNRVVPAPRLPNTNASPQQLVLTGDDDEFDNSVYLIQPKPEQVRVVYLGEDTEKDTTQPAYYLNRAFQQTRTEAVHVDIHSTSKAVSGADLAQSKLVIASGNLPAGASGAVKDFLLKGGTVLYLLKGADDAATLGDLAGANELKAEEIVTTNYAMFGQIDFAHPLFAPFSDPRYNDFTKIHFWKYRKLDTASLPGARELAKFDSGDPMLLEWSAGRGHLLALTSGWQPSDSQLALSSKFVPILYSMLEMAGGVKKPLAQVRVGEPVDLASVVGDAEAKALLIRKPDGSQVQLSANEMRFTQTDAPGIYEVISAVPPVKFAVNLDASESRTAPLAGDALERLGVPMKAPEQDVARQVETKRRLHSAELENQQKLWRWLTLIALVVLLVETWLAGRFARGTGRQTEVTA